MTNNIKSARSAEGGKGLALQVTHPARGAGLVEEDAEGTATRLADVYVYGFDGLLLVIDAERVPTDARAELVTAAADDTDSIYRGAEATLSIAGHGYQVQLPGCERAGFDEGDSAPVASAPDVMAIHDGTGERLATAIQTLRREQTR